MGKQVNIPSETFLDLKEGECHFPSQCVEIDVQPPDNSEDYQCNHSRIVQVSVPKKSSETHTHSLLQALACHCGQLGRYLIPSRKIMKHIHIHFVSSL
jgi:hypothetical protein